MTLLLRITIKNMLKRSSHEVVGELKMALLQSKGLRSEVRYCNNGYYNARDGRHYGALREIVKIDPNANVIMVSAMGQEAMVRESILQWRKRF